MAVGSVGGCDVGGGEREDVVGAGVGVVDVELFTDLAVVAVCDDMEVPEGLESSRAEKRRRSSSRCPASEQKVMYRSTIFV